MPPKKQAPAPPEKIYRGIYKNQGMWRARLFAEGGEIYLGHFLGEEEAAKAYDRAVLKLRGYEWCKKFGVNNDVDKYDLKELAAMNFDTLVQTLRQKGRHSIPVEIRSSIKLK